jgi:hypothetical protein
MIQFSNRTEYFLSEDSYLAITCVFIPNIWESKVGDYNPREQIMEDIRNQQFLDIYIKGE